MRAGLTGLGAVFLVTAAAALLFGPEPGEQTVLEQAKEPGEPLAQLGVAPSNENGAEKAQSEAQSEAQALAPGAGQPPPSPESQSGPGASATPSSSRSVERTPRHAVPGVVVTQDEIVEI